MLHPIKAGKDKEGAEGLGAKELRSDDLNAFPKSCLNRAADP